MTNLYKKKCEDLANMLLSVSPCPMKRNWCSGAFIAVAEVEVTEPLKAGRCCSSTVTIGSAWSSLSISWKVPICLIAVHVLYQTGDPKKGNTRACKKKERRFAKHAPVGLAVLQSLDSATPNSIEGCI